MKFKHIAFLAFSIVVGFSSCVPRKKLKKCEVKNATLDSSYMRSMTDNAKLREELAADDARIKALEQQLADNKSTNSQVMSELKDLSVISGTQAESIKKSLENIGVKDAYIKDLQAAISRKDSLNMALVINLKSAVGNLDDKDINIKVEKGVVYVDISDKLLFTSGSYDVTDRAREVLGKVAKVVLAQPDIEFMVEGNTDNAPFKRGVLQDNWDLSVMRATSVVRILQDQYHVPSAHMTAAGRGSFQPVASNDSKEGMAANRRTRIIILPQLDQFFKLLEKPKQ
jgi:chemotaxis protein MotB